jgi:glycosyltransferase involved in cell wall biosynthesis
VKTVRLPLNGSSKDLPLTVILCVLNEEKRIVDFGRAIRDVPFDELIIVDGGSEDETVALASTIPRSTVVSCEGAGLLSQRMEGVRLSSNELILLANVDDSFDASSVAGAVQELVSSPGLDGVQFGIACPTNTYWERCWGAYFRLIVMPTRNVKILGRPCLTYRRLLEDVPEDRGIFNEDTWIGLHEKDLRRNYRVSRFSAFRSTPTTFVSNFRQFWRYGESDFHTASDSRERRELLFHALIRIGIFRTYLLLRRGEVPSIPFTIMMGAVRFSAHISSYVRLRWINKIPNRGF